MAILWLEFPTEIQLHVINHLDREDWKKLRLTSKSNATLAETQLFRTVHLTPNTRSFDRARNVATSHHLARYVHVIVYHVGVLEDVHSGYQTFRDDIIRLHHPSGSYDDITKDILWKYNCFLEEMDGQRDFETRSELDELRFLCRRFVSLQSVSTILDEYDDPFEPPQDFIGQRTGVQSACSADGPHFSNLFKAAAGKVLTSVYAWSVSWRCMSRILHEGLESVDMKKIKHLALGLFNSEYLAMESEEQDLALKALDTFLAVSTTAEQLQLDFDEIPFESGSSELRAIPEVVFKHSWPSLKKLALQGVVAQEHEIISFFEKHSSSLTHLLLDDIELEDETCETEDDCTSSTPGSIITLFRRTREVLSLETASISGCFTNRFNESWYVNLEYEDENCLRRDIEMWLIRKAPSPFPDELVYPEAKTKQQINDELWAKDGAGIDVSLARLEEEYQDGSWVWTGTMT